MYCITYLQSYFPAWCNFTCFNTTGFLSQVTIAPKKTKLSGSLSPTTIEEIIQLLNFVASTRMYKAVILTGKVG